MKQVFAGNREEPPEYTEERQDLIDRATYNDIRHLMEIDADEIAQALMEIYKGAILTGNEDRAETVEEAIREAFATNDDAERRHTLGRYMFMLDKDYFEDEIEDWIITQYD